MRLITTEAVTKFHPDKYADQISDAIVTAYMRADKNSRCGIEVMVKDTTVIIAGEISSSAEIDIDPIVYRVAEKLGYQVDEIDCLITEQSPEISRAVDGNPAEIGAGDQGMVFGYASSETESKLPVAFDIANRIVTAIEEDVDNNPESPLRGDGKTQVTIDLDTGVITNVVVSVCHKPDIALTDLRRYVRELLKGVVYPYPRKWHINPAGAWTVGGPTADCGLTGRKIVCDQSGGAWAVGGGSLSGKDVSKIDRTATYMARRIACELVDKFRLHSCAVQLAYVIGRPTPVSVYARGSNGFNYGGYVVKNYDLTVKGMIDYLNLYDADFEVIAEGCHFFNKETGGAR